MTAPCILMAHPSPDLYGSDRVLLETVSGYLAEGWRVVVALPADGPLTEALRERGAETVVVATPVLRKSYLSPSGLVRLAWDSLRGLPQALRLIGRLRPALVLVNTVTIPLWILAGRLRWRPVVGHVHEAEQSASLRMRRMLYFPLLFATGLIVNSRFSLDVLASAWPRLRRRSVVVYNGVPGPEQPTPPRERLAGPVRLLFLGRLSPRKGPQVAVDALHRLVGDGMDVHLQLLGAVFPGYEWFEAELHEQIARLGLGERVEFLGFDPDIWRRLDGTDIVLVPSTVDEPFGNTAVEAMLARRPLVVSETSGLVEASAGYRTAKRVPAGDPAALAAAIGEIVAEWAELTSHSVEDLELARQRHAPAAYQRQIVATVSELSGTRGSRRSP